MTIETDIGHVAASNVMRARRRKQAHTWGLVAVVGMLALFPALAVLEAWLVEALVDLPDHAFWRGVAFIIVIAFCSVPPFIAHARNHKQTVAITIVSFGLGWSAVGWIVALAWACMADQAREDASYAPQT